VDYDKTEMPGGYDAGRGYSPQQLESWLDVIARSVAKLPSEILDLGCGTGRYSAALAERFGARVIGVEPSDKMLAEAGRKASVECQLLEKRCAMRGRNASWVGGDGALHLRLSGRMWRFRIRYIMEYLACSRTDPFSMHRMLSCIWVRNKKRTETPRRVMDSGRSAIELHPHPIIGRLDMRRQFGAQFRVVEIAMHVGEDRALRADAVDPLQRQVEVKMARMRAEP
jgi:SAM-dependent methyltransferase